jgi:aryl-alcohol dehydrogenase-like predicted oxidoreductase
MHYREFGRTGWRVSEIAFGGWQLGGQWGPVDDEASVATKVRPVQWPAPTEDDPLMRGRYPSWYLRQNVEQSLTRLGVERIDLFQLHGWFRDGLANLDWLETLNLLRVEGKIDRVGVSIRDYRPEDGVDLARSGSSTHCRSCSTSSSSARRTGSSPRGTRVVRRSSPGCRSTPGP